MHECLQFSLLFRWARDKENYNFHGVTEERCPLGDVHV